jgi:outer membrane protein assembly factor BamA
MGCGAPARVRTPDADYLRAIRIEGNRAIATADLAPGLALHGSLRSGAAVDPYLLDEDARRIRGAYQRRGFFWVKVTPAVTRDGRAQDAVFTVEEGRRATTQVVIAGLPPEVTHATARARIALRDGAPFDYDVYDTAKQPLAALVADAGYARVHIAGTVTSDPAGQVAVARYDIVPGERCTFGAIRFAGTAGPALEAAVRARLAFATGEPFSLSALARSQAQIYEIGRFATVELVPELEGRSVIDVVVELSEANRHEVHAGGGVGVDSSNVTLRLRGGYSYVPAWDPLLTVAVDARGELAIPLDPELESEPKIRAVVAFQRLDLLRPRLRGELAFGADRQDLEAYTWKGGHVRLGLGSPLGTPWLQLRVGWVLEQLWLDVDDAAGGPAACQATTPECTGSDCEISVQRLGLCESPQRLGGYQASLVADLRDNPIEPRRGAYFDLRATVGTPLAGSEREYLQLSPEVRGYLSIGEVIVAGRARAGAILGDVPVTQRYYSGGASGHRGFGERELSPRLPPPCMPNEECVVGGAALIETGVELRRRLGTVWTFPIGANVFLDGGDVTDEPQEIDPGNLYWAVGAGLWGKLVGDFKFRVGLGYRLNRTGPDDPHATECCFEWHFGVGEAY